MTASIITIGDEILIGQIVDTNSSYIAKSLDKIGIETVEMLSISDNEDHIINTLKNLQNKVDVVIITGGLGPTKDDITKKTFCKYFEDTLIYDENVLQHVTELIEVYYKRPISQINKDQALVPTRAKVLFNKMGTAPGIWMEKDKTVFISLPGVPYEMKYLIEEEVIPNLIQKYDRPFIVHKTIMTYGKGESLLAEEIEDWEDGLPSFVKLAYLPSPGRVRLRLTARGVDENKLKREIDFQIVELNKLIAKDIVGFDEDESIEVVVGKLLRDKNATLATAESCTGGKIAQLITSIPGASNYFKGSVVSYATEAKISVLGLDANFIKEYSVVSAEVVREMALSVQKMMNTDYAIATTGNAGPLKGDANVAIGTVFIAIVTPKEIVIEEFNFGQPREKVIDRAVNKALEILYKEILKN
jgi:nicotinamide-nucleotide amidase